MSEIAPIVLEMEGGSRIDLTCYLPLFEDETVSDADKLALLEALWSITLSLARIGWGVNAAQQAKAARALSGNNCGEAAELHAGVSVPVVGLQDQRFTEEFNNATEHSSQEASEL